MDEQKSCGVEHSDATPTTPSLTDTILKEGAV